MIPNIDPVDRTLILKELTADKLLRKTNNVSNVIKVDYFYAFSIKNHV